MTSTAFFREEIKDRGIVLYKRERCEDDLLLDVLTLHYGRVLVYAFKGNRSKRRFAGQCQVMRHVEIYARRGKGGWVLQELVTLNAFSHLTQHTPTYLLACQALRCIRELVPLECNSNHNLYLLLGGFLQELATVSPSTELWELFEIKAFQYAGLFSLPVGCGKCGLKVGEIPLAFSSDGLMCLDCHPFPEKAVILTPSDQQMVLRCLREHHPKALFQGSSYRMIGLKLKPYLGRIREEYNLARLV